MDQREASEAIAQTPKLLKWIIPDSIRTDHATHLVVQQQGSEFMLLFFELQGPVLSGTLEEQLAAYNELTSVEAKCVAKLVMSAENVALATNSLIEGLNRLNALLLATKGREHDRTSEGTGVPTSS